MVHESGHVAVTLLLGGTVEHVILHPLTISQTVRSGSRSPLCDCWAGPLLGAALPAAAWLAARRWCPGSAAELRLFAGFCLLANGVYLGLGWIDRIGDAGEILDDGGSLWSLILFGLVAIACGLWFIDGGQRTLGFGAQARTVTLRRALAMAAAALALTLLGVALDLRRDGRSRSFPVEQRALHQCVDQRTHTIALGGGAGDHGLDGLAVEHPGGRAGGVGDEVMDDPTRQRLGMGGEQRAQLGDAGKGGAVRGGATGIDGQAVAPGRPPLAAVRVERGHLVVDLAVAGAEAAGDIEALEGEAVGVEFGVAGRA
jgi:hypothetical protein